MIVSVTGVEHLHDYTLLLTFDDGARKTVDLAPYLDGEVFEPLRDVNTFSEVRVNRDTDTIEWANGADMSPDFLYEIGCAVGRQASAA